MRTEKANIMHTINRKVPKAKRIKFLSEPIDSESTRDWSLRSKTKSDITGCALVDYDGPSIIDRLDNLETRVGSLEPKVNRLEDFHDKMVLREVLYKAKEMLMKEMDSKIPGFSELFERKKEINLKIIENLVEFCKNQNSEFNFSHQAMMVHKPMIDHLNQLAHIIPYKKNTLEFTEFTVRLKRICENYINKMDETAGDTLAALKNAICVKKESESNKKTIEQFHEIILSIMNASVN